MLSLISTAVLGVTALFAADSASATKLCTNSGCSTTYPAHTTISGGLNWPMQLTANGGTVDECTTALLHAETENGSGEPIEVRLGEFSYINCSQNTSTVNKGSWEIFWTSGTNGKVVARESELTTVIFGVTCVYGAGTGTKIGTLTGGIVPVLAISAALLKTGGGFLCPAAVSWDAEYIFTAPHALYVGS